MTTTDLKKRYYELAMTRHPDRGGDPHDFAELSAAYERLMARGGKARGGLP